jgi:hypothetical protein
MDEYATITLMNTWKPIKGCALDAWKWIVVEGRMIHFDNPPSNQASTYKGWSIVNRNQCWCPW